MIIANPIYDSVFKYLLEDIDIAKGILSAILDEEIIHLTVKPQEHISEIERNEMPYIVYRLDFKAIIQLKDGSQKKVLIELQKTKRSTDVMRFRRYLADNYYKEDETLIKNESVKTPLEIVTVYLLGFKLDKILVPILKVSNCFYDVSKQEFLKDKPKESFIDLLNHESYTIQIPRLPEENQTELENVLSVFQQRYKTEDSQRLDFQGTFKTPLTTKIIDRLNRAIANDELRMKMNIEEEFERTYFKDYNDLVDQLNEKDSLINEKDSLLANQESELEKLRQELEQLKQNKK